MSEHEDPPDGGSHTITLEEDGVRVEKRLAPDEFDTPAVVFTIESDRDAAAYVQITDPLPESIDPDDVGLHPEYDSEGWRRRGGDLQFEGRLDPGEKLETVYGLRVAEVERPSALLADPRIDELVDADIVGDATRTEPRAGSAVDVDMGTGGDDEGDDGEGSEDSDEGGTPAGGVDLDLDEEGDGDEADPDATAAEDGGGEQRDGTDAPTVPDGVAAALAAELEAGEVDDSTKATLSDHLEIRLSKSSDVRLDSVQARLSDLEAYTDALEGILDRVGTDQDVLTDLSDLRGDIDTVQARLDDAEESLEDVADRTDEVESTTADLEATTDDLAATVEDLEDEMTTIRDRLDAVDELSGAVEAVDEELASLREEVTTLREEADDDLEGLRDDVEELKNWRETLASSIAGGMGGGDDS